MTEEVAVVAAEEMIDPEVIQVEGARSGQAPPVFLASVANERLWVGHTSLCATPGPPLVWHRLAVTSTAAAPGAASARSAPPAPR